MQYWYNITTGRVESDEDRGPGDDVMGPYATADEAGHALETARRRTEEWDQADREWAERGAAPGRSEAEPD